MAKKKITSLPGLLGGADHYDENGQYIGFSAPGLIGGAEHYDENGKYIGFSAPGLIGGRDHFNAEGKHIGFSADGPFGGAYHYDADGHYAGFSAPGLIGGSTFYGEGTFAEGGIFDLPGDGWGMDSPFDGQHDMALESDCFDAGMGMEGGFADFSDDFFDDD